MPPIFAGTRAELVALAPDVLLAHGAGPVAALLQVSRTVPIVFPILGDPVGAGYVDSLARPGGNVTGFMNFEFSMGGKWLETTQTDCAKRETSGGPSGYCQGSGTSQFAAIQAVAPSLRVEIKPFNIRDTSEIERDIEAFAHSPDGGLIVTTGASATLHRDLIITLAARHKLPAVYYERFFVAAGGLVSYGPITSTSTGARRATSTASSKAKRRPIFQYRRLPSTSWRSTSRPPRRLA